MTTGVSSRGAAAGRIFLLALLWGSSFLWIKIALRGLSPVQIVLVRLTLGTLILGIIVHVSRLPWPRGRATWAHLAVAALVANVFPYLLFALGEETVSSSLAGSLNASTPLWTFFLSATLGREKRDPYRIGGLALGLAGCLIILAPWTAGHGSIGGAIACLGAALSYAVSYIYMDAFLAGRGIPPLVLAASQLAMAAFWTALMTPFAGFQPVHITTAVAGAVATLGILGTGGAYVLNYRIIADEGPTAASAVTYLLPIVAVILGALVLGEPLPEGLILGVITVLFGVALVHEPPSRR